MQLLTIPFSHYNERARWAMQHHGLVARERRYLPIMHMAAVRRVVPKSMQRADKTGGPTSTPVLVLRDGQVLPNSSAILRWVDEHHATPETTLYPAAHREAIEALEQRLHDDVGRDTRFLAYWFLLADAPAFAELVRLNAPLWQRAAFFVGAPVAKVGLRKRFRLTAERYEKIRARFESTLDALGEALGDRAYFFGDRFTAADLTSAAMLSPLLAPLPRYGAQMPSVTGEYAKLREQIGATRLGRHTRRMFALHRPQRPEGWILA